MNMINTLMTTNLFLYICITIGLLILITLVYILTSNYRKRVKIKKDFVEAEKTDVELSKKENNELESLIQKMQEEINLKPEDVVKKFEEEQEEKAIISYKELVDNVKAGNIEVVEDEVSDVDFVKNLNLDIDELNEPIMEIEDSDEEEVVTPEMVKSAIENISINSIKEEKKKFKQSDFISPIFGIMDTGKLEYPTVKKTENIMDLMNTKDYNELTEEIKRQEEFLQALKEFRNNL